MARHKERRSPGSGEAAGSSQKPTLFELTRFSGVKLREINLRAIMYADSNPGYSWDQLVDGISVPKERTEAALEVINQLGSLSAPPDTDVPIDYVVSPDDVDSPQVIVYGRVSYQEDKRPIYDLQLRVNLRELWAKFKTSDRNEEVQVEKPDAPKADYPFKTAEQREAERVEGIIAARNSSVPHWRERRDQRRAEKARREEIDKVNAEKNALRELIVDTGQEIAEREIRAGKVKIELGEDGLAVISYKTRSVRNPDGSVVGQYIPIDRDTGFFEEGDTYKYKSALRPEVTVYLRAKAREQEYVANPELPRPPQYQPEKLLLSDDEIYARALKLGLIKVEHSPTGVNFMFAASSSGGYDSPDSLYPIELDQSVVRVSSIFDEISRPIRTKFTNFLKMEKAELDAAQDPLMCDFELLEQERRIIKQELSDGR